MTRHKTLATIFLTAICGLTAWSQGAPTGCDDNPSSDQKPRTRTQVTGVTNAGGQDAAVGSHAKEMKVARLIFVGNPALPLPVKDEIAKAAKLHDYDDNKKGLDELLDRVRDAWQHNGYFTVKVEPSDSQTLDEDSQSRTVAITLNVDAGTQYRLDEINFENPAGGQRHPLNPLAPEERRVTEEQLRAFFPLQPGDVFDTHKIQAGLEELRQAYGARGFINFAVIPSTKIDEASGRITLFLDVQEGEQFRIGNIEVKGIDSEVFRKLLLDSGLVRGEVFKPSQVEDFKKQSQSILLDFGAQDEVERRIHQETNTVDLTFILRSCDGH